ncbi:MAG TPA: ferrochelatase [Caldimonas sp.]|nr:ferrochelatase [Caldimonas sp.]HEX2541248.1 ferrochelatase [Caldimonas sp.]
MTAAGPPAHAHGTAPRTAVVVCNLGTPDAPTTAAVRRYLAEFLSDPRVVEIPRAVWLPLLHGVILRTRPARSARKYASIWTPEGSPLAVWTQKQALMLDGYLGERGHPVLVRHAMRYGRPSVASVLDDVAAAGADRVLVLPLYPQYSAATTASIGDAVTAWTTRTRNVPELRFLKHYHDDPGYIAALARRVEAHWMTHGRPDKLVLSFHGMPRRTLELGDPYHCECRKTGRLLADRLKLREDFVVVTFQSRFGRAEWLKPYTEPTAIELARAGVRRIDVFCPGFTADCLETLEEIDQEVRAAFLAAGGTEFGYIPCLNDSHDWIAALADIAIAHMGGWPAGAPSARELDDSKRRAVAAGAPA